MTKNSVTVFLSVVSACLAVAFIVVAVLSGGGVRIAFAVLGVVMVVIAGALLRVGTLRNVQ